MSFSANSYIVKTKRRYISVPSVNEAFTRSLLGDIWNKGEKRLIIRRGAGDYTLGYTGSESADTVVPLVPAMRIQLEDMQQKVFRLSDSL